MCERTTDRGLPYLTFGDGPPLVVLPGITGRHRNPPRWQAARLAPGLGALAESHTVHLLQLRPGLPPGTTMADLADDVAAAIREDLGGGPLAVYGVSTGGSVALQLAVDHPELVSRLALVCAAARLGEDGRRHQRRLAELTLAGRPREAWAQLAPVMATTPHGRWAMHAVSWLAGGPGPRDAGDLLAVIDAEDAFDVRARLHEVAAPTLVLGGALDGFYSAELFAATAGGIPGAQLVLRPRSGHVGALAHRSAARAVTSFLAGEEES